MSSGKTKVYQVLKVCSLGIKRHINIKADANPYMAEYARYFADRRRNKGAREMRALSTRAMRNTKRSQCRVVPPEQPSEMLEPCEANVSSTVLRGKGGCKAPNTRELKISRSHVSLIFQSYSRIISSKKSWTDIPSSSTVVYDERGLTAIRQQGGA